MYSADLLAAVGMFGLNESDNSLLGLLDRLAGILVFTALGGTLHVLLFSPVVIVGGALLGLVNGFYLTAGHRRAS